MSYEDKKQKGFLSKGQENTDFELFWFIFTQHDPLKGGVNLVTWGIMLREYLTNSILYRKQHMKSFPSILGQNIKEMGIYDEKWPKEGQF